jgi:glutathione synthase/RimK-type ligase-like ATP-grasp enzyme
MTSKPHIAILVPSPDNHQHDERWPGNFETLAAPLRALGATVEPQPWIDGAPPEALLAYDRVLPLLAWGYHLRTSDWFARLALWQGLGVRLDHDPEILRWNTSKAYLAQLAAKGAPVTPSLMVDGVTEADLAKAREQFQSQILVIKPQISAGAHQTLVVQERDQLGSLPSGPVILQPFLPSVGEEGELSLFYFGGVFSHAVAKVARHGDFRVQPQYGGATTAIDPSPEARNAAAAVLAACGLDLTYARVDLIRCLDGGLRLMELEVIEPDLFLAFAPDGGAAYGRAILKSLL